MVNMLAEALASKLTEALVNMFPKSLVNMLTKSLVNMLAEALVNIIDVSVTSKQVRLVTGEEAGLVFAFFPVYRYRKLMKIYL